jgi:hypothetical protein
MSVILQEVVGKSYEGKYFYPTLSGVGRSINFYPIPPEKPEDAVVSLAYGLGKYIVDGFQSLRFCPKYPKKVLQLSTPELALRDTQKYIYALDLNPEQLFLLPMKVLILLNYLLNNSKNILHSDMLLLLMI